MYKNQFYLKLLRLRSLSAISIPIVALVVVAVWFLAGNDLAHGFRPPVQGYEFSNLEADRVRMEDSIQRQLAGQLGISGPVAILGVSVKSPDEISLDLEVAAPSGEVMDANVRLFRVSSGCFAGDLWIRSVGSALVALDFR